MKILKFLSSSIITVICLFLLFVLTFWGTIAQVHNGLYTAQERFFNSFFFLAGGVIPFPGAQLVLWLLFINLLCTVILNFKKYTQWKYIGLIIIHLGLLLYFVAAYMVFQLSKESHVSLAEGQLTNVSTSYHEWELAYWTGESQERQVTAINTKNFKTGLQVFNTNKDFRLTIKEYYPNCELTSDSNLMQKPLHQLREQNKAGVILELNVNNKKYQLVLLGNDKKETPVRIADQTYYFALRHQRFPLPFTIKLDQFKAEFYPGTEIAKTYESLVTINTGSLERDVRIYMNNPLRYKDYTLYQASYSVDNLGRQYSTLAVVKNSAWVLPYVACFVVFLGLALHFLMQAFNSRVKS